MMLKKKEVKTEISKDDKDDKKEEASDSKDTLNSEDKNKGKNRKEE